MSGPVILMTGATGSIGTATALAAAEIGAELILAGRQVVKLERLADRLEDAGGPVPVLYPVDLAGAGSDDYAEMAAAIERECGRLDAVVHLAADFPALTPLMHSDDATWQRAMMVNLHAVFLISRAVYPLLRAARGRLVVTLDDPQRVGAAYWGAYGVAKVALGGLVGMMADEWEADGIRVFGIVPPPTRSRLRGTAFMEDSGPLAEPDAVAPHYLKLLAGADDALPATGTVIRVAVGAGS